MEAVDYVVIVTMSLGIAGMVYVYYKIFATATRTSKQTYGTSRFFLKLIGSDNWLNLLFATIALYIMLRALVSIV